jgi:hypothetical protein
VERIVDTLQISYAHDGETNKYGDSRVYYVQKKDVDGYVSCEGAWLRAKTDLILFDLMRPK